MATEFKYLLIYDNTLAVLDVLTDVDAGRLFKAIACYQQGRDISQYTADYTINALLQVFIKNIEKNRDNLANLSIKRKEAGRQGGLAKQANATLAKQKIANVAIADNNNNSNSKINNNNKINNNIVAVATKTRTREQFVADVYTSQIKMENIMRSLKIDLATYKRLAADVLAEWKTTDAADREYNWKHLHDHMRIKLENSRNKKQTDEEWRADLISAAVTNYQLLEED